MLAVITETEVVMADVVTMEVADIRLAAGATTETATIVTKGGDLTRVREELLTTIGEAATMTEAMIVEVTRQLEEAHLLVETISHRAETNLLLATVECPPSEKAGGENNNALTAIEA